MTSTIVCFLRSLSVTSLALLVSHGFAQSQDFTPLSDAQDSNIIQKGMDKYKSLCAVQPMKWCRISAHVTKVGKGWKLDNNRFGNELRSRKYDYVLNDGTKSSDVASFIKCDGKWLLAMASYAWGTFDEGEFKSMGNPYSLLESQNFTFCPPYNHKKQ